MSDPTSARRAELVQKIRCFEELDGCDWRDLLALLDRPAPAPVLEEKYVVKCECGAELPLRYAHVAGWLVRENLEAYCSQCRLRDITRPATTPVLTAGQAFAFEDGTAPRGDAVAFGKWIEKEQIEMHEEAKPPPPAPTAADLAAAEFDDLAGLHPDTLAKIREALRRAGELEKACGALLNAPHHEHFVVRLNDEEMAALTHIRLLVEAQPVRPGVAAADTGRGEG